MAVYITNDTDLTKVANAIRTKGGTSAKLVFPDGFANAVSAITTGITPTGTKEITANGEHDVTSFAKANVNVPIPSGYIKPSGTKSITVNGTHDVASYASVQVNVPMSTQKMVTFPITISSTVGNGTNSIHPLLSENDFVKQHYADDSLLAMLLPIDASSLTPTKNVVTAVITGNRPILQNNASYYGVYYTSNGETSAPNGRPINYKINASGYNVCFRATSGGNLNLYVASTYTVLAGSYLLILALAE